MKGSTFSVGACDELLGAKATKCPLGWGSVVTASGCRPGDVGRIAESGAAKPQQEIVEYSLKIITIKDDCINIRKTRPLHS